MKPVRILVAAHQPIIGAGLRLLLGGQAELAVVGEATNASEALSLASQLRPDVLLLTPWPEEESTFDFLSDLATKVLDTRVLVLTSNTAPAQFCNQVILMGVVGIVYNEQSTDILFRAIKCVAGGEVWLERSLMATVLTHMSRTGPTASTSAGTQLLRAIAAEPKAIDKLTARELELINLIGEGLKNKQIAARLFITELTVRNHLASIYNKLGVSNRLALAIYAYNNGLLATPPR